MSVATGLKMTDSQREALKVEVEQWRDSAVADGWSIKPTYQSEVIEQAASLERDEFHAQVISRPPRNGMRTSANLSIWGPDGLAIEASLPYNWQKIQSGLRVCGYCKAKDVDTQRVGFAGRCCTQCLSIARKSDEYPGWCD